MRYIKEFANATALQAAVDNGELGRPYLCYLQDQGKIAWDSEEPGPTPETPDYFRFIVKSNGVIKWKYTGTTSNVKTIEYSKDSGNTWNSITSSTGGTSINVSSGDTVLFRGNNNSYASSSSNCSSFSGTTCQFDVEGNIMSLVYGDNFSGQTTLKKERTFLKLFQSCRTLLSAENLILPATTLTQACYRNMFGGCTSLTTAPTLPAKTLANECYYSMFDNCSSLKYIKCLATDISANGCTTNWVYKVSKNGTFVKKSGVNWPSGYSGIPDGWTVIEE